MNFRRNLLFVLFQTVLLSNVLFGQTSVVLENKLDYLDEFIGILNGKHLYMTKHNSDDFNSRSLYLIDENNNVFERKIKGEFNLPYPAHSKHKNADFDTEYKELFIFQDTLYSLIQKTTEKDVMLYLKRFNNELLTHDSIFLFHDSITSVNQFNFKFKRLEDQIGLIGTSNKKSGNLFYLVYNLKTSKKTQNNFLVAPKEKLTCTDFIFNQNQNLVAIFEGVENNKSSATDKIKPEKLSALLLFFTEKGMESKYLNSTFDTFFNKSYKFVMAGRDDFYLTTLTFKANNSFAMTGYKIYKMSFNSFSIENENYISSSKLIDPNSWAKKYSNKLAKNKFCYPVGFHQRIKEIIPMKDGTYIIVSESNYNDGVGSAGSSGISAGTNFTTQTGTISSSPGMGFSNSSFPTGVSGIIIVSRINFSNQELKWTTLTKDRSRYNNFYSSGKTTYFLDFNELGNKMTFYYPDSPKNYDEFGSLKEKIQPSSYFWGPHCLVKFEITLTDGLSSHKVLQPDVKVEDSYQLSVANSHVSNSGKLVFVFIVKDKLIEHLQFNLNKRY